MGPSIVVTLMGSRGTGCRVRERSLSFSAGMVKAVLAGHKTETRRVVKESGGVLRSPYGESGDALWVREAWRFLVDVDHLTPRQVLDRPECGPNVGRRFEADGTTAGTIESEPEWGRYRHARFMPRPLSRIRLVVVEVRIERLHEIDEAGAQAEGVEPGFTTDGARGVFADVWEGLNGPRGFGWASNPRVWVVRFRRNEPEDSPPASPS